MSEQNSRKDRLAHNAELLSLLLLARLRRSSRKAVELRKSGAPRRPTLQRRARKSRAEE